MVSDAYNKIVNATDHTTTITDSVLQGILKRLSQGAFGEFEFSIKGAPNAATDTTIRLQLTDTANLLINTNNLSQTRFAVEYVDNRTTLGSEFRFLWIQKQATDAGDGSVSIALDSSPDFAYRSIVIGGGAGQFSFSDDAVTTQIANTAGTTLDAGFRIFRNDNIAVTSAAVLQTISLRNATYRWILSGTTEYYVELAAGGDPGLNEPDSVLGNALTFTAGTIGGLAASEWVFGNNDSLGFTTVYVRLADGTDPDSKAVNFVTAVIPRIVVPRWVNPLEAPHNAVGDGTNDDNIELLSADTAAGVNGSTYIEAGITYHIAAEAANPTFVSDFIFDNGGLVDVNTGVTVTFDGPITAGEHQKLFTGAGTVALGSKVTTVSAKWFGAVGDGVADDSTEILAAFASMSTAGGVLKFPAGTYLLSAAITIGSATVSLEFAPGAKLKWTSNGNSPTINGYIDAGRTEIFDGANTNAPTLSTRILSIFPEWFNAKGDNSTDDTTALQRTADAMFTGAHLIFAGGTYIHGAEPLFSSKTNFVIDGNGSILKNADSTSVLTGFGGMRLNACSNFVIRNLILDGNRANRTTGAINTTMGITIRGGVDWTIEDCICKNSVADGIYLIATTASDTATFCKHGTIRNVDCDNNFRNGMSMIEAWHIKVEGGTYRNTNGSGPEAGIDIEPNPGSAVPGCKDISVKGASFLDNTGHGVNATTQSRSIRIEGNYFEGCDKSGVQVGDVDDYVVIGNQFYLFTAATRGTIDITSAAKDVVVSGNQMDNIDTGFTAIFSQTAAENVVISDNVLRNISAAAGGTQPAITADTPRIKIVGNIIDTAGERGISATGADSIVESNTLKDVIGTNIIVSGNRAKVIGNVSLDADMTGDKANGILRATAGADAQFRGNTIFLSVTDTAVTAIKASAAAVIDENHIAGCSTTPITLPSTTDDISIINNPGDHLNAGWGQAPNVASANTMTCRYPFKLFRVTGTTQINAITVTEAWKGRELTLIFVNGVIRLNHNNPDVDGSLLMSDQCDALFNAADHVTLAFEDDGSNRKWREISRKKRSNTAPSVAAGFTLEPSADVAYITSTAPRTSDVTTAISDGCHDGHRFQLINANAADAITIKDGANTDFSTSADIVIAARTILDVWWDVTNSVWRDSV